MYPFEKKGENKIQQSSNTGSSNNNKREKREIDTWVGTYINKWR